jgi:hypothetical protein
MDNPEGTNYQLFSFSLYNQYSRSPMSHTLTTKPKNALTANQKDVLVQYWFNCAAIIIDRQIHWCIMSVPQSKIITDKAVKVL